MDIEKVDNPGEHESGVVHFQEVIHGLTISSQQNTSITELP